MFKVTGTALFAGLLLASLLIACPYSYSSSASDKTIRIGFMASLSGHNAPASKATLQGVELYLDRINHKMAGRPVQLFVEDDEGSPSIARRKFKKLIELDKCVILDGFTLSHIGYAVADATDRYQIPTVFAVTAADNITQREHHPWIIRTGWTASQSMHPFGEYAHNTLNYKNIACIAADYPFGYETVGGFQKTFENQGGRIVQKMWCPIGCTDYMPYLKAIRPGVDAIFILASNKSASAFFKQFSHLQLKIPVLACGTTLDEVLLPELNQVCLGALSASIYSAALARPQNRSFVKDYDAKYKREPGFFAEAGYTSVLCIDRAIASINGNVEDRAAVMAAFRQLHLTDAPRGPIKFDAHGNPIENVYIRKVEKVNGKLQNSLIFTLANVSQFWKYDPAKFLKEPPYGKDNPPCRYCATEP